MLKLTPSTAFTEAPTPALKCFTTLTTRSSGSTAGTKGCAGATAVSVTDRLRDSGGHLGGGKPATGRVDAAGRSRAGVLDVRGPHVGICALHGHPACRVLRRGH